MNQFNAIALGLVTLILSGCMTNYPNQDIIGKTFPSVVGESLEKEQVVLPEKFNEQRSVLLIGYVQNSQFDIDRWLIGLDMTNTSVPVYELPTIAGMFPQFFETQINNGMRKGIPKELWKGVITIYEDGETVQAFTGNQNPNNARAIVIDDSGTILFFHDRGFSVDALKQLRAAISTSNQ
ncbi:MAG: hypothetical protein HWE27_08970 [Gammaproteobacteria bacterium]|nr:hypothetical protein [Gammaproteobacteria bacterium]